MQNFSARTSARALRVAALLFLAGAAYAGYRAQWHPESSASLELAPTPVSAQADSVPLGPGYRGKPIEQIQLGERVVGHNPIREQAEDVEPDPVTWRHISLYMEKEGGEGLWIELLRPLSWIEDEGAEIDETIYLDLPELSAAGDARVTAISNCPEIHMGTGEVVTGTFKHLAKELVELTLEGETKPLKCTPNHPFWSDDRKSFVPAGELRVGENLLTFEGHHVVVNDVTPHDGPIDVYNLEVANEHVYFVGSCAVLVHNSFGANRVHVTYRGVTSEGKLYTGYASAPKSLKLTAEEIIARRYGNNFSKFGGAAPSPIFSGEGAMAKRIARGLEQRGYQHDLATVGSDVVANAQNPVGALNPNRTRYLNAADNYLKNLLKPLW